MTDLVDDVRWAARDLSDLDLASIDSVVARERVVRRLIARLDPLGEVPAVYRESGLWSEALRRYLSGERRTRE